MIGFYNYTVILTYLSLASSMTGIFLLSHNPDLIGVAVALLLFSGLCDMFDGRVARMKKRTSMEENFGAQIDSLSDMICFGVYPAVIGYHLAGESLWAIPVLIFFVLCGLIRLAFFDVRSIEKKYNPNAEISNDFVGLPITCAALLSPLLFAIRPLYYLFIGEKNALGFHIFVVVAMLLTALAFVIPFRVKKPNKTGVVCLIVFGVLIMTAAVIGNIAYAATL